MDLIFLIKKKKAKPLWPDLQNIHDEFLVYCINHQGLGNNFHPH